MSFFLVSAVMLVAGAVWIASMKALARDTAAVAAVERHG